MLVAANSPNRASPRRRARVAEKLPRERLAELRTRSGLSVRSICKQLQFESPNAYHRYERKKETGDNPIPLDIVRRLIPILVGRGNPTITADEVMSLADTSGLTNDVIEQHFKRPSAGTLPIRCRIEPGIFVRSGAEYARGNGGSVIGPSFQYDTNAQFVAVVRGATKWYLPGDQVHCVEPSRFSGPKRIGRRAVVAAAFEKGALVEITVAEIGEGDRLTCPDGKDVVGRILGIVIGAYRQE